MSEKYYLVPGSSIGKKGLPGGKLTAGKEPLLIEEKYIKVIEKNLGFFLSEKRIVKAADLETEKPKSGKTEKRLKLEAEAIEFEIEFTDRTSGKDLEVAIEAAKKELED